MTSTISEIGEPTRQYETEQSKRDTALAESCNNPSKAFAEAVVNAADHGANLFVLVVGDVCGQTASHGNPELPINTQFFSLVCDSSWADSIMAPKYKDRAKEGTFQDESSFVQIYTVGKHFSSQSGEVTASSAFGHGESFCLPYVGSPHPNVFSFIRDGQAAFSGRFLTTKPLTTTDGAFPKEMYEATGAKAGAVLVGAAYTHCYDPSSPEACGLPGVPAYGNSANEDGDEKFIKSIKQYPSRHIWHTGKGVNYAKQGAEYSKHFYRMTTGVINSIAASPSGSVDPNVAAAVKSDRVSNVCHVLDSPFCIKFKVDLNSGPHSEKELHCHDHDPNSRLSSQRPPNFFIGQDLVSTFAKPTDKHWSTITNQRTGQKYRGEQDMSIYIASAKLAASGGGGGGGNIIQSQSITKLDRAFAPGDARVDILNWSDNVSIAVDTDDVLHTSHCSKIFLPFDVDQLMSDAIKNRGDNSTRTCRIYMLICTSLDISGLEAIRTRKMLQRTRDKESTAVRADVWSIGRIPMLAEHDGRCYNMRDIDRVMEVGKSFVQRASGGSRESQNLVAIMGALFEGGLGFTRGFRGKPEYQARWVQLLSMAPSSMKSESGLKPAQFIYGIYNSTHIVKRLASNGELGPDVSRIASRTFIDMVLHCIPTTTVVVNLSNKHPGTAKDGSLLSEQPALRDACTEHAAFGCIVSVLCMPCFRPVVDSFKHTSESAAIEKLESFLTRDAMKDFFGISSEPGPSRQILLANQEELSVQASTADTSGARGGSAQASASAGRVPASPDAFFLSTDVQPPPVQKQQPPRPQVNEKLQEANLVLFKHAKYLITGALRAVQTEAGLMGDDEDRILSVENEHRIRVAHKIHLALKEGVIEKGDRHSNRGIPVFMDHIFKVSSSCKSTNLRSLLTKTKTTGLAAFVKLLNLMILTGGPVIDGQDKYNFSLTDVSARGLAGSVWKSISDDGGHLFKRDDDKQSIFINEDFYKSAKVPIPGKKRNKDAINQFLQDKIFDMFREYVDSSTDPDGDDCGDCGGDGDGGDDDDDDDGGADTPASQDRTSYERGTMPGPELASRFDQQAAAIDAATSAAASVAGKRKAAVASTMATWALSQGPASKCQPSKKTKASGEASGKASGKAPVAHFDADYDPFSDSSSC